MINSISGRICDLKKRECMKKILFACVLMIGTSNVSVADSYLKSLFNDCNNGSMQSCDMGIRKSCVVMSDYYTNDYKVCSIFQLRKGILLYGRGDYTGSHKFVAQSIRHGNIDAQQVMGEICSKQPWVCRGNGLQ